LVDQRAAVAARWGGVRFGALTAETVGPEHRIAVEVFLNGLAPGEARVELFADGQHGGPATCVAMAAEGVLHRATVAASRPAADYTPRVTVVAGLLAGPLEAPWILWQK
jgi:starch phosphorylase